MESWEINGATLEYDDDTHTYICDGCIVPSVTQILETKFGNKYDRVDSQTLKRAADRGTAIHKAIEMYCRTGEDEGSKEVHNFKFLCDRYGLKVRGNEIPIVIWQDWRNREPIAAGRLDIAMRGALGDIKTTSVLDMEYLAYQLNLYRLGYQQSYGIEIFHLYGFHLREDRRKLVELPVNGAKAWELIEEYQNAQR